MSSPTIYSYATIDLMIADTTTAFAVDDIVIADCWNATNKSMLVGLTLII